MKRPQILLTWVGVLATIAGSLLAVSSALIGPPARALENNAHEDVVYVGANTCFTCHDETRQEGWHALHPQTIQNPIISPQVVVADFNAAQAVQPLNISSTARAFTLDDATASQDSGPTQRYVMQTENGTALLPGTWVLTGHDPIEVESMDWVETCADCHTEAGSHIHHAEQLGVNPSQSDLDSVRQTIVTTTDPQVCRNCHIGTSFSDVSGSGPGVPVQPGAMTTVAFNGALDGELTKAHLLRLQTALPGTPADRTIYRRENPIR